MQRLPTSNGSSVESRYMNLRVAVCFTTNSVHHLGEDSLFSQRYKQPCVISQETQRPGHHICHDLGDGAVPDDKPKVYTKPQAETDGAVSQAFISGQVSNGKIISLSYLQAVAEEGLAHVLLNGSLQIKRRQTDVVENVR